MKFFAATLALASADFDADSCWNKCVLYQPAHMCQYACNQQETFVPPALLSLKSIDDLVTDYGMEFDVDPYALMALNSRDAFSGIRMDIFDTEADWETNQNCFDMCMLDILNGHFIDGTAICNMRCF